MRLLQRLLLNSTYRSAKSQRTRRSSLRAQSGRKHLNKETLFPMLGGSIPQAGLIGLSNLAGAAFFACVGYALAVIAENISRPHVTGIAVGSAVAALGGLALMLPVL
ncbi:hypothetical protein [Paraburkholderia sp. GAS42]|uniref:hypothetical protein n=1 Tax=Paraburkholderia sp. GAS42 TaxID=3035135 RepID=UPI003D1F292D